jgi:hypothetical protein
MNIFVSENDRFHLSSTSKGNQIKWFKDNINLLYNESTDKFCLSPVFDNGLSLLSDTTDYPLHISLDKCLCSVKSKPFSTSFSKQVSYFKDTDLLKIDYDGFIRSLDKYKELFSCEEYRRAKNVILKSLEAKEGLVWQRA